MPLPLRLFRRTVVPGRRSSQDRRDIGHPRVVGRRPFPSRKVRTELCPEQRLNLRTGAISQREVSLAGKAGAAEEHAHLRKQERRPPDCASWSVTPEGRARRRGPAAGPGDPHPGAFEFHVRQCGVLSPSATTRCAKLRSPGSQPGASPARQDHPSRRKSDAIGRGAGAAPGRRAVRRSPTGRRLRQCGPSAPPSEQHLSRVR